MLFDPTKDRSSEAHAAMLLPLFVARPDRPLDSLGVRPFLSQGSPSVDVGAFESPNSDNLNRISVSLKASSPRRTIGLLP